MLSETSGEFAEVDEQARMVPIASNGSNGRSGLIVFIIVFLIRTCLEYERSLGSTICVPDAVQNRSLCEWLRYRGGLQRFRFSLHSCATFGCSPRHSFARRSILISFFEPDVGYSRRSRVSTEKQFCERT